MCMCVRAYMRVISCVFVSFVYDCVCVCVRVCGCSHECVHVCMWEGREGKTGLGNHAKFLGQRSFFGMSSPCT